MCGEATILMGQGIELGCLSKLTNQIYLVCVEKYISEIRGVSPPPAKYSAYTYVHSFSHTITIAN